MSNIKSEKIWNFPEDQRLFNLGFWAGQIGWLVLLASIVQVGLTIFRLDKVGGLPMISGRTILDQFIGLLSYIQPIINAFFLWFVLQAMKQLLYAIIDIKDLMVDDEVESEG